MEAFKACFQQNEYQDIIADDLASGRQAGVTGTPSVLINGRMISPGLVPSYQDIEAAVQTELAQSGQ